MNNVYIYIIIMAGVTYLIRMLPIVLSKKEITNKYVKSFLYYVPYACLASMIFPAILYSTSSIISAIIGMFVAVFIAYKGKSLIVVASISCASVFLVERILDLIKYLI